MQVLPVIHHIDRVTSIGQVQLARGAGADGVFLIAHDGNDVEMMHAAWEAKQIFPDFAIGANIGIAHGTVNALWGILIAAIIIFVTGFPLAYYAARYNIDLDLITREALAVALNEFEGTLMLVSHDRALLRSVCDEFWLVGRGAIVPFDGDLDDYQSYLLEEARRLREVARSGASPAAAGGSKRAVASLAA